jgi:hypothetical protein
MLMASNYNPSTVTSGLVLSLDAGNVKSYPGSGATWTDLSQNGNNGTLVNSPTFNSANGGSLVFDGTTQYSTANSGLINNSNFTVSFWIYYMSPYGAGNSDRGLISTWDTSWQGFGIGTSTNGTIIRSWARNGAGGGMNWGSISTIANGWHNLVLVYDYATRTQSGYIDTTFRISEIMSGSTITHSTLQISRGGQTGSTQLSLYPYLNARFGNVNIYSRALSAAEIAQNYNALRGRYGL